ncbi:RagB/SusD family nutrient uptake outer membrane protein [Paucihalobacter ruber]|nr:RagB/SusD family nutrient uptake outer membrane protein [Paucihalobacter ruber]
MKRLLKKYLLKNIAFKTYHFGMLSQGKFSRQIKIVFNHYTIIILLGLILFSCSDFLEQEPGNQTSITELLSTKEGVLAALNGTYTTLEASVREERFAVYADMQGGNIKFTPIPTGSNRGNIIIPFRIENVYSFQDQAISGDFSSFYQQSYSVINQANLILEFVDDLIDATNSEKNQIKAEALSIRAYAHFLLALVYAQNYSFTPNASHLGIVYNRTTLTESGVTFPSRETLDNTYTLIIDDIQRALSLYTNLSALDGPIQTYFNENNTKAILARVYLNKNDWQNAFETAIEVINTSGVNLTSQENYLSEWENSVVPMTEILLQLSVPRDSGGSAGGSLSQHFGFQTITAYGNYVATNDLLSLYESFDIRSQMFLEQSLATNINGELENVNYYFTRKFQDTPPYPAVRLSEMYLIASEAAYNLNRTDDALNYLNFIRVRANASLISSTTNLQNEILNERRRELAFEGHYFFDLGRNQRSITRNDGCLAIVCDLNYPSPKYVLPIPQENINLNSNLQQNESY